jgi:hypothetical protein
VTKVEVGRLTAVGRPSVAIGLQKAMQPAAVKYEASFTRQLKTVVKKVMKKKILRIGLKYYTYK